MINFKKIEEIYGKEMLDMITENKDNVQNNIMLLYKIGFEYPIDFFERIPYIFTQDNKDFEDKITKLISKLGDNYIYLIESDISLMEALI